LLFNGFKYKLFTNAYYIIYTGINDQLNWFERQEIITV